MSELAYNAANNQSQAMAGALQCIEYAFQLEKRCQDGPYSLVFLVALETSRRCPGITDGEQNFKLPR
jgi:hypothetical protein